MYTEPTAWWPTPKLEVLTMSVMQGSLGHQPRAKNGRGRFGFWLLTREGRMLAMYRRLRAQGATPAAIVRGDPLATEVVKAPSRQGGRWRLYDGRTVHYTDILRLDAAKNLVA